MGAVSLACQELLLTLSDVKHGIGQDLSLLLSGCAWKCQKYFEKWLFSLCKLAAGLTQQMNADVSWEERALVEEQVGNGARKWLLLPVLHW